jgi:GAF domain-containing protein
MLADFRIRQRDYLLEISRAISAQLDLAAVLRLILEAAVEMVSGQAGLIALRQEDGGFAVRARSGPTCTNKPTMAGGRVTWSPVWRWLRLRRALPCAR